LPWIAALSAILLLAGGCSSDVGSSTGAASQPATVTAAPPPATAPAASVPPPPNPLLPERESWSRQEALLRLADEGARVSAAVRLVRLAGVRPLCVPDPLSAEFARQLRVVALSDASWAIGLRTADERQLCAPALICEDGRVVLPAAGPEEEIAVLHIAENPDIFPHLLITLERVWIVAAEPQSALLVKSPAGLWFDIRQDGGYAYVALLWQKRGAGAGAEAAGAAPVEVGRYKYDPYELAFLGPLADKLPDPPGGLYELDLEQSQALVPVGGVIPEPPPVEEPGVKVDEGEPPPY